MTSTSTSSNPDLSADPIYVTPAEADLALERFPTENPFAHLVKPEEAAEPFSHLTVETPAPSEIDTAQADVAPARGSARAWLVAGVILLGAAFGASIQPLVRSEADLPAPKPTSSNATLALTPPVVTPPVVTPPIVTPPPAVPVKTQPLRADAAPSSTVIRTEPAPVASRAAMPPPPPSPALAIATDARLPAAQGIAPGEIPSPPKPSPGPRTTNTASAPIGRATTSASPPPPVAPAPASPREGSSDASAVQAVVDRYARAFSDLDVGTAGTIWPDVDVKALTRSFEQLDRQSIVFSECQISVTDVLADASCVGQTRYVPKVGRKSERVESHEWSFRLRKTDGRWLITSVRSK